MLKCEGWRGRERHLFEGCFVFTAVPEASFNYFKAMCNVPKTTDAEDGEKRNISLFLCQTGSQTVNGAVAVMMQTYQRFLVGIQAQAVSPQGVTITHFLLETHVEETVVTEPKGSICLLATHPIGQERHRN